MPAQNREDHLHEPRTCVAKVRSRRVRGVEKALHDGALNWGNTASGITDVGAGSAPNKSPKGLSGSHFILGILYAPVLLPPCTPEHFHNENQSVERSSFRCSFMVGAIFLLSSAFCIVIRSVFTGSVFASMKGRTVSSCVTRASATYQPIIIST